MRGFFEIGVYHPKTAENIGTLLRSAYQKARTLKARRTNHPTG